MSSDTHPESNINHHSTGFLDLECATKIYPYQGIRQFWDIWETEWRKLEENMQDSEWVLFTDVDKETFTRDFLNSSDNIILRSWNSYDKSKHFLLTKMPVSLAHEAAVSEFAEAFLEVLRPMGLHDKLYKRGSATRYNDKGAKQPELQFTPKQPPVHYPKYWLTVVVEVAVTEPASKLKSDIRYWLGQSNGGVEVVMTLQAKRDTPEIILEKWEPANNGNRCPRRKQRVIVYKGSNDTIKVDGGPLIIDFEKLFLRPPGTPKEKNIELGGRCNVLRLQYGQHRTSIRKMMKEELSLCMNVSYERAPVAVLRSLTVQLMQGYDNSLSAFPVLIRNGLSTP
ncbi:hypothetical protein DTO271G3_5320 [Paecilomyces variotii]|nr:hypothetical protein DTO271G3_5320 [Paecilomyces variotii]